MSSKSPDVMIVGLGLMGGSLAYALRPHVGRLTAIDTNAATRDAAVAGGTADAAFATLAEAVAAGAGPSADTLLILAVPVQAIISQLDALPALLPAGCQLLDLGSTKVDVCRAMGRLPAHFSAIGGHPMCGREVSGFAAADGRLYAGQTFILTPTPRTTPALQDRALGVVRAIGAEPLLMIPAEHDQSVALVSHLPYVVSALLMQQAFQNGRGDARLWQISASGFKDTTRIAGSDPAMMRDILVTNRRAVLAQLRRYQRALESFSTLLEDGDAATIYDWLADRQGERRQYMHHKFGGS